MKSRAAFVPAEGEAIRIETARGSRLVRDLDDLRGIVEGYEDFDQESVARFGLVAALLAVRGLRRAGTEPTRSNIARTLDEYYFVLRDQTYNQAFQRGLEEGVDTAVANMPRFEEEVWRRLC
jgi:hypothetical protein